MKKYFYLSWSFSLFLITQTKAQRAEIVNGNSQKIHTDVSTSVRITTDTLLIPAMLIGTPANTTFSFVLQDNEFPNAPQIGSATVTNLEWRHDSDVVTLKVPIKTKSIPTDIEKELDAQIKIADTSKHTFFTIRLGEAAAYDSSSPFWVELGSNFDLIDKIKPNNLYAGVFFYKRDMRKLIGKNHIHKKNHKIYIKANKLSNIGIFAGVFESKALSSVNSSIAPRQYITSSSYAHPSNDSMYVFNDTGTVKRITTVSNIGLLLSPQLRLSNGSSNEDGLHFFAGYYGEIQWQHITNSTDFSATGRHDTLTIDTARARNYNTLPVESKFNIYTHYLGINLPLYMAYGDYRLFVNPVFGGSNQASSDFLQSKELANDKDIKRNWHFFYAVQFRLNDEKYGIAFSGEVRGLTISRSDPFVTLVLSKKFDLHKLIEFGK